MIVSLVAYAPSGRSSVPQNPTFTPRRDAAAIAPRTPPTPDPDLNTTPDKPEPQPRPPAFYATPTNPDPTRDPDSKPTPDTNPTTDPDPDSTPVAALNPDRKRTECFVVKVHILKLDVNVLRLLSHMLTIATRM